MDFDEARNCYAVAVKHSAIAAAAAGQPIPKKMDGVCVFVCVCARVRVCERVSVSVCMCVRASMLREHASSHMFTCVSSLQRCSHSVH